MGCVVGPGTEEVEKGVSSTEAAAAAAAVMGLFFQNRGHCGRGIQVSNAHP